jgi:hypothetical protein
MGLNSMLLRAGVNRGFLGGNRFFATLGAVAAFVRLLQRISGTGPRTLYTGTLKPGDVLVVTEPRDPEKRRGCGRGRRRQRKLQKTHKKK